jgi:quercetin dioxygenase-like cupin family protein
METKTFEATLAEQGYRDVETKALQSTYRAREHSHPFDVRALVLEGEITLTVNGDARTYRAGDVFTMDAGCAHAESVGSDGVRYLVGRRAGGG